VIEDAGFEAHWQLYRRSETRLPRPRAAARAPRRVEGLRPLLDAGAYDAVVLDAWGVLNLGDVPIPAAREAFAALRGTGLAVRVVSNDAGCDPEESAVRHTRRGFPVSPDEIVFGLDLLGLTLARLGVPSARCALIAPRPAPRAAWTQEMIDLGPAADGVAFLSTVGFGEREYERLAALLRERARPLVVCNPDIVSPEPEGIAVEPGYYAHRLADELGITPFFLGKPFPEIYDRLLGTLPGVRPERVLCVGDTLHTDVLGGAAAGMDTLLVESGFFRGESLERRCAEAGLLPTWLAAHL